MPEALVATPNPLLQPDVQLKLVRLASAELECDFTYGGFRENRSEIWRGSYLEEEKKFIHLGIDYNVPAGTDVHLPKAGLCVDVLRDTDQNGGWGGRVIIKIDSCYVIFAHLMNIAVEVAQKVDVGTVLGHVGDHTINGNWYPHLHLQCLRYPRLLRPALPFDHLDGYASADTAIDGWYPDPESEL